MFNSTNECTRVRVTTKTGTLITEGSVILDDGRYVSVAVGLNKEAVYDRRYYAIEAVEPASDQSEEGGTDSVNVAVNGKDPGITPVEPPAMQPLKPKSKLNDDDVERLLARLGDAALAGLKGMGLKSGAIYPLMIKLNDAIKASLSQD